MCKLNCKFLAEVEVELFTVYSIGCSFKKYIYIL